MRTRRAPRPLALAVEALADRVRPRTALGAVQAVWPAAVGEALAREAEPVAERDGTLTVLCSSAVWAQELELMAPVVLGALERALEGPDAPRIGALRCTATRGRRPSPRA